MPLPPPPQSGSAGDPDNDGGRRPEAHEDPHRSDDPARDPYLAVLRTRMAWTRTALAFAAVGGVMLKASVPAGVAVLATCPLVWAAGRLGGPSPRASAGTGPAPFARRFRLITLTIIAVAVVALVVSVFARGRAA